VQAVAMGRPAHNARIGIGGRVPGVANVVPTERRIANADAGRGRRLSLEGRVLEDERTPGARAPRALGRRGGERIVGTGVGIVRRETVARAPDARIAVAFVHV